MDNELKLLLSEKVIKKKVKKLARQLSIDYSNKDLLVLCVLKGGFIFCSDLIRELKCNTKVDFIQAQSYGEGTKSSNEVKISLKKEYYGKEVLIVEDILDTGLTLNALTKEVSKTADSVKTCVLLDKKDSRITDFSADYVGFVVKNDFIVGYGLDYAEKYRNLKSVYLLQKSVYNNK